MYCAATCLKTEKMRISKSIVAAIREINGRFLERTDGKTSVAVDEKDENGNPVTWRDIGDKRAIEKTSQALREGQPKLLKKLAVDGVVPGSNSLKMNRHMNHIGAIPQSQSEYSAQSIEQNAQSVEQILGMQQTHAGHQPPPAPPQNPLQPPKQPFTDQERLSLASSFTFSELVEDHTFSSFPRNSFVENNNSGPTRAGSTRGQDSWQDSWGSENPAPLRNGSRRTSQDSWDVDPMPLPYKEGGGIDSHVFSTDDHQQLMSCLDVNRGDASRNENKRPSVKFQLQGTFQPQQRPSASAMSLASHLSELSIFSSDALSLDSAMEAVEREAEFEMLGEFDQAENSVGSFDLPSSSESCDTPNKPRRSILRRSNKYAAQSASFPPAPLNTGVDPGMIFTSTLDTKPGGVNSGTDVSSLLGERRKSVVAFEVGVDRRRSSRMSLCR